MPETNPIVSILPLAGTGDALPFLFREGDVHTAQVMQVLGDSRYVLLIKGRLLLVESLLDLLLGQTIELRVKEASIPVQLEVIPPTLQTSKTTAGDYAPPDPSSLLLQIGITPTEKALKTASAMLGAGIPLNHENFLVMSSVLSSIPTEMTEPILAAASWMSQHGITLDSRLVHALGKLLSPSTSLGEMLALLVEFASASARAIELGKPGPDASELLKLASELRQLGLQTSETERPITLTRVQYHIEQLLNKERLSRIQSLIDSIIREHPALRVLSIIAEELSSRGFELESDVRISGKPPAVADPTIGKMEVPQALETLLRSISRPSLLPAPSDEMRTVITNLMASLPQEALELLHERIRQMPEYRMYLMKSELEHILNSARELVDRTSAFKMLNLASRSEDRGVYYTEIPFSTGDSQKSLIARISYRKSKGRFSAEAPIRAIIEMETENLGPVRSELEIKGKRAKTEFQVGSENLRKLFAQHHNEFLESLRALGLEPTCSSVVRTSKHEKLRPLFKEDIPTPVHPSMIDVVA